MIFRASVTSSCCGGLNTGSLGGREMLRRVIVVSLLATLYMSSASAQNIAIESTENLYTQCLDHQRVMRNRNNNWPAVVLSNALKCSGTMRTPRRGLRTYRGYPDHAEVSMTKDQLK